MTLSGDVIIARESADRIELVTEKLTLNTTDNTAYTDKYILIKTPYGDTESVGLHAALEDETINLHSKVRGHYNAPQND
jgi:lipopolysaccharide export system protein LptC